MGGIFERKLAWGFGLVLAVLSANALVSYRDLAELSANTGFVVRSRSILETVEDFVSTLKDAESSRRGYLIDGNLADLDNFERAAAGVLFKAEALIRLTSDRPAQLVRCIQLDREARARLVDCRNSISRAKIEGLEVARGLSGNDPIRRRLARLVGLAQEIEDDENLLLERRIVERRSSIWRSYATFSIASTLALALIGSLYFLLRRYLAARRSAERTLRESEARVRLLLDSAGEGVYGVDINGLCTFCNPAALELLGFDSDDQVLGRDMHELIHHTRPDGSPHPVALCPIYKTFRTGQGILGEEDVFHRADGNPMPVEYRAHPIRRDGETIGAVITFVDIAPRRHAEVEMRLRDRALRAITQGIFITDPARSDEPIIYVNAAFERLTGYSQGEVAGRNIDLLRGPGTSSKAISDLMDAFEGRRAARVDMLSYRKDGTTFWTVITVAPVEDSEGRVSHFVGVVTDITGPKRDHERLRDSEGRLRMMIESVRDYAIFSIDLDGKVSSWNAGAERLFGFSEAEILGRDSATLFTPEERESGTLRREISQAEATGRSEDERWHVRKDGSRFLASGMVTAVRDEAGVLLGYTKVARDITGRKRAEAELLAAKEAAEVASRAKSTFLANMSHEFRTPLNAIIGYSELIAEDAKDRGLGDIQPDLEKIHSAGKHLLGLINDVLDLSKIEAGRMELFLETFPTGVMLRDVLATIRPQVEKAGNTLRLEVPDEPGDMRADQTKVRQCLLNLLSNSAKFTQKGTITLRMTRDRDRSGREWVVFIVKDDGIGLTPEEISKLFRPFVQADASTTRRYGGTGLGLTITRRFCEMMGGEIVATGESGRGSTFTIRLPAEVDEDISESLDLKTTVPLGLTS